MSASLRTCLQTHLFRCNSLSIQLVSDFSQFKPHRCHSGGRSRIPTSVRSSDVDDQNKLKNDHFYKAKKKGQMDPSKNPYIKYDYKDPIQRSMKNVARSRPKYESEIISEYDQVMSNQEKVNSQQRQQRKFDNDATPSRPRRNREDLEDKSSNNSEYRYEKLEPGSKLFSRRVMFCKSKDQRDKKGIILLEGKRLIVDAIIAGAKLKELFITEVEMLNMLPSGIKANIYKIPYKDAKIWSDTQTPSGILAIFEKPEQGEVYVQHPRLPITVICDQVRDPGNMGTLIRTAAAVGCERILAVKGCADPWDPKVLRSGMSAHFHIPIVTQLNWNMLTNYLPNNSQVLVADNRIPEKITQKYDTECIEYYQDLIENDDDDADLNKKFTAAEHKVYKSTPLSLTTYDKLNITADVAFIIGNEYSGISPEAKKFVFQYYGQVVTIPMIPAINSLNVTSAASVILYEIRRQLCLKENQDSVD